MNLRRLHKWFTYIALLAVVLSFSGFTSIITNYQKPQTELVHNTNSIYDSLVKQYKSLHSVLTKVSSNPYTFFSSKNLLNKQHLNFSVKIKSQKEKFLEFTNYNDILEQNLIAKSQAQNSNHIYIK